MFYDHYDKPVDAERSYRQALTIQEAVVAADLQDPRSRSELSQTLYELGYFLDLKVKGGLKEAVAMYERLVAIQEGLVRESPTSAKYRSSLTGSLSYLAAMYARVGRFADAEKRHSRAITIQKGLVGDHPEIPLYQLNLAKHYVNLGNYWRHLWPPRRSRALHLEATPRRGWPERTPTRSISPSRPRWT